MAGLRRTDGIVFGPEVKENFLQEAVWIVRISLAEEMATKPEGEFALLSRKKKGKRPGQCLDSLNGRQRRFCKAKESLATSPQGSLVLSGRVACTQLLKGWEGSNPVHSLDSVSPLAD